MKRFIVVVLVLSATSALADTYKWEDANGMHFTDNLNSVPKKYRKKALAGASGDITTKDPETAASVAAGNRRRSAIEAQDRKEAAAEQRRKTQALTSKVECQGGVPGECGPGRACVYQTLAGSDKPLGKGYCTSDEEATRTVVKAEQQQRIDSLNAAKQSLDKIRQREMEQKIDDIHDRLRPGY